MGFELGILSFDSTLSLKELVNIAEELFFRQIKLIISSVENNNDINETFFDSVRNGQSMDEEELKKIMKAYEIPGQKIFLLSNNPSEIRAANKLGIFTISFQGPSKKISSLKELLTLNNGTL